MTRVAKALPVLVILAASATPTHAVAASTIRPEVAAAREAAAWLDKTLPPAQQTADALGERIASVATTGAVDANAVATLKRTAPAGASRPAYAARIVMGIVASGGNPRSFGGVDYVAKINAGYNAATGTYETGIYAHALTMIGLIAAAEPVPRNAVMYLTANQCPQGGFAYDPGCIPKADVDTTSITLCALIGAGAEPPAASVAWLESAQHANGGFPHVPGDQINANSTGLALSAFAAMKRPPPRGAIQALLSLRSSDGGFSYVAGDAKPNQYATIQAIPGLMGSPYPIRRGRVVAGKNPSPSPSVTQRPYGPPITPQPSLSPAATATQTDSANTPAPGVTPSPGTVPAGRRNPVGMLLALLLLGAAGYLGFVRPRKFFER